MKAYQDLLQHILANGEDRPDRTGTGTRSVFGYQFRHDLSQGFPLLTTKKVHFKSIVHELLWFLSGSTNNNDLLKHGITIWNEWADPVTGDLGPIYSHQWRNLRHDDHRSSPADQIADQIADLIEGLKNDPTSRRHIVSAWNVTDLPSMALPPCHHNFQCYVHKGRLSLAFQMRSSDVFLGLPYNIASYALLTHMLAHVTGLSPGELIYTGGDVHLYHNHFDQAVEQIFREPKPLPFIALNPCIKSIDDFTFEDVILNGYDPHPAIKAPVAV